MDDVRPRLVDAAFARITAANLLFFFSFTAFFLLPVWMEEMGASEKLIGLVMGAGGLAAMVTMPLTGAALDRVPRRRPFLIGGYLALAASAASFAFVDGLDVPLFVAIRVAMGVAFGVGFTTANVVVMDVIPDERRGQGIAVFGVFILLTHALGPTLGEVVAHSFGFPALFVGCAVATLVGAAILPPESGGGGGDAEDRVPMVALALRPGLFRVLVLTVAAGAGFGCVLAFLPVYMKKPVVEGGLGLERVASYFLAYSVAAIHIRLVGGRLTDLQPRLRLIAPASVGFALSIAALGLVHGELGIVLCAVGYGTCHGLLYPSACALAIDRVAPDERGRAMALYNVSFNVGATSSVFAAGVLIEAFGYPALFAGLAAGCAVVAAGFAARERAGTAPPALSVT